MAASSSTINEKNNDGGALLHSDCPALRLLSRGKVRDLYAVPSLDAPADAANVQNAENKKDDDSMLLLLVATDRISAFDCILGTVGLSRSSPAT